MALTVRYVKAIEADVDEILTGFGEQYKLDDY
jgi:hypothetical protein